MLLVISIFVIAILVSLGAALRHLFKDDNRSSGRMVWFLTIRVGLSIALFALLLLAWYMGWIQPHPIAPPGTSG